MKLGCWDTVIPYDERGVEDKRGSERVCDGRGVKFDTGG